jgi:hypothetical protein
MFRYRGTRYQPVSLAELDNLWQILLNELELLYLESDPEYFGSLFP